MRCLITQILFKLCVAKYSISSMCFVYNTVLNRPVCFVYMNNFLQWHIEVVVIKSPEKKNYINY